MSRLEKIMLSLSIAIMVVNIAIVTLKVARMDDKLDKIIEFENLNEVVAY